jgi:3-hydroxyacyl-CoA dehydrogenase / enoyl-CoA hydratase / 3-hydroxybutyryl-CoA epimerase
MRADDADAAWGRLREARGYGGFGVADAAIVLADAAAPGTLRAHLRADALLLAEIPAAQPPPSAPAPAAWFRLLPEISPTRVVEILGSDGAAASAHALFRRLGFLTLPISQPDGLWEPLARRLAFEAARAVDGGIPPGELEASALEFGMAIGPLRLADEIGLEHAVLPDVEVPDCIRELLARGRAGRHADGGFYDYARGSTPELPHPLPASDAGRAAWREICARLRAGAEELLRSGGGERRSDVDLVSVLALGFPVERGGLLHDGRTVLDSPTPAT